MAEQPPDKLPSDPDQPDVASTTVPETSEQSPHDRIDDKSKGLM
jgi:hypothetical protein